MIKLFENPMPTQPLIVFATLILAVFLASTGRLGAAEWHDLTEHQSRLYLALDLPKTIRGTGWNERYSRRSFRIGVFTKKRQDPRANINLKELAPNYFYPTTIEAKDLLNHFKYFKPPRAIVRETALTTFNGFRATHIIAEAKGRSCLLFSGKSGQGGGDIQTSEGTAALYGYYCHPAGKKMTEYHVNYILASIGMKNEGDLPPENLPALTF